MSLPPGFLEELRDRLSIAQVVGRKVMWDARKSNQGKGDMWAPCPFHQEKSASFHVDDRKGYYYCFGCHAKGDAITFVRETENVGFMEAVRILAGEAGMPVPQADPAAQAKADRRTELTEVMEAAVRHYRMQLKTAAAAPARAYLEGRGLGAEAIDRWELGFAPDAWQGLWDHLRGQGVAEDLILEAGLAKPSQKGGNPYDTFRGRIQFPIRDGRGRAIAFGGRAMDPGDSAKYLNSPETPLFDKGRSLYNHGPARAAAGKGQPLILAEGYMDVIALSEAGFTGAVAPLGTAVTEDQLRLLWRIAPEPIVALDGDQAGVRAAQRLIDLALPMLEAGQSLRFSLMPGGQDPDDVIRAGGAQAMQTLIDAAKPMVALLWERETEGLVFDSPERRAALDKRLRAVLRTIADPSIRTHYGDEVKRLRGGLFAPSGPASARRWGDGAARGKRWGQQAPSAPRPATRQSALAGQSAASPDEMREAVILATLLTHPGLGEDFAGALESASFSTPLHRDLANALLRGAEWDDIAAAIGAPALENLMSMRHVQISPSVRNATDGEAARICLAEEFAKLEARRGQQREVSEAMEDIARSEDEGLTWRLGQAARALDQADRSGAHDTTEFDVAPNGARLDKDERSAFGKLLDQIDYGKTDPRDR